MEWLKKVRNWFTPARRAAVYAVAVAIVPLLNSLGIIPTEQGDAWLTIVSAGLQVVAGVLMVTSLSVSDAAAWFTAKGRAAIYSVILAVAPALQVIGLLTAEASEEILQNVSHALGVLVAIVAAVHMPPKKDDIIVAPEELVPAGPVSIYTGEAPKVEGN